MAEFKTHTVLGGGAGILFAVLCCIAGILTPIRAALAAVLFTASSDLPDLDSDNGVAKRFLFEALAVLVPSLIVTRLHFETMEQMILTLLVLFFIIRYPIELLFDHCTIHHGIFHSIPMAALFTGATLVLFYESPQEIRIAYAAAVGSGFLFHLIIDEIWVFGLFGLGAKKSFGSSLKLYSNSIFATVLTYLIAASLFYVAACLTHPPDWPYNVLSGLPFFSLSL